MQARQGRRSLRTDDSAALGLLAIAALVVGGGLVGTGVYLYATDFAIEADVVDTHCQSPVNTLLNSIDVKTKLFGIDHNVGGIAFEQCQLLREGDRVEYHIRTKHTTLYDSDGQCIHDSETGAFCGRPAGAGPHDATRLL